MNSKIRVNRNQLEYFKRVARQSSPFEVMAYLIGEVVSPTLTTVSRFAYTKEYYEQTAMTVSWSMDEYDKVKKRAEDEGLVIVGSIHSHPNYFPILSSTDCKSHVTDQVRVSGVYGFIGKKGMVCFWVSESFQPLKKEYVNV